MGHNDSPPSSGDYNELPPSIRRRLSGQRWRDSECGVHKLTDAPNPIRNANSLRWRRAQGFMSATEVVVCDVQRDRRNVIIKLL